jgi:phage anti-repressor protein
VAEMTEKRDEPFKSIDIDGLICSDRSKGNLSIIRVDLFLSIDDTRYLSILDPSERNRYVSDGVYIVCRAPKRFFGQLSSIIHRSNALAHLMGGKSKCS